MRTPHLSKGFYLLGIALLSMSLIALVFSIFDGERTSAVRVATKQASKPSEIPQRQHHDNEPPRDSVPGNIQPSDAKQTMVGGSGEASDRRVTTDAGSENPDSPVDESGKSNSRLDIEIGAKLSENPRRSVQNTEFPSLPLDASGSAISDTEKAAQSANEKNDELASQVNSHTSAKGPNQNRDAPAGSAGAKPNQEIAWTEPVDGTFESAKNSQREVQAFTLASLNFDHSPFRLAIDEKQNMSDGSFTLVSDALRQQTPDKDESSGLFLPSTKESPAISLFSPVVITGLPARMQNASTGDLPNSELVRKQVIADVDQPSFSGPSTSLALNETTENISELTGEAALIPENESMKYPAGLIDSKESVYEPLVSRPVEKSPSDASPRGGEAQPRLAMLQTPSPSGPKPDTEEESDSEQDPPAAPTPKKEAEDDEEHMISELVGGCYGCFSRVLDSGLYASNEFTFLSTSSIGDVRIGVTDMLSSTTTSESTKSGIGFGNRTTVGIRGAFAGLRATYWTFGANEEVTDYGAENQAMPKFVSASGVDAETVDLEITQPFCIFGCRFESSVGARYANYQANDTLVLVDQMHNSLELTGIAKSSREINGAGPTLALAGRKNLRIGFGGQPGGEFLPEFECAECGSSSCLGECNTWRSCHGCFPWNIYWNGRISWLWADESGAALTEASVFQHDGNANIASARSRDKAVITDDSDSSIYTLSFQIGLEYCRPIFCRSQCVIRAGFEYQHWDLGKNVAESQSFAFLTDNSNFGGRVDSIAQSSKNYVDLAGFTLMLGLNY